MIDTTKTDDISNQNDLPKDQNPLIPFEVPVINKTNAADSFQENNPTITVLEQSSGEGDINIPPGFSSASVVVTGSNEKVPKWFYFIFILTLIIFIAVTVLLVKSVMQKSNSASNATPTINPVAIKAVVSPTIIPVPTIEATDAGTLKISQVSSSDEIKDIENDIKTTDFSPIETGLSDLDSNLDFKVSL